MDEDSCGGGTKKTQTSTRNIGNSANNSYADDNDLNEVIDMVSRLG